MNPQAIIAALPWLRRIWRVLPPPLRIPLLLVVAAIAIVQFVQGRKQDDGSHATEDTASAGGQASVPSGR